MVLVACYISLVFVIAITEEVNAEKVIERTIKKKENCKKQQQPGTVQIIVFRLMAWFCCTICTVILWKRTMLHKRTLFAC